MILIIYKMIISKIKLHNSIKDLIVLVKNNLLINKNISNKIILI
jgi:hypothetical protein